MQEATALRESLLPLPPFSRATHNIWALVLHDAVTDVWRRESDDDGESGAGMRLSQWLERMGAANVLVIVSRRYGGVQLGNDRFRHINACAQEVVQQVMRQQQSTTQLKESTRKK
jgi:putative IMPACT (imprinted ancient) family translation regulator